MGLRFFLDQDVDVRNQLQNLGYECWTASEAGLGSSGDDELTIYAQNRDATLLTHDREFSRRRQKNVIGRHIWLDCNEWLAAEVVQRHIDELAPLLERKQDLFVHITVARCTLSYAWQ